MLQEIKHIVHMVIRSQFYIIIFFFNFYSHVQQTDLRNNEIFQIILTTKSHKVFIKHYYHTLYVFKKEFKEFGIIHYFFWLSFHSLDSPW